MLRIVPLLLAAMTWLAPIGAAPGPKERSGETHYFPTVVGSMWVYECDGHEDTLVVTAAEAKGDATIVSTGRRLGERIKPDATVAVSADGLAWVSTGAEAYDPPIRRLRLPLRPGEAWEVESTGPDIHLKGKATAHRPEKVKVPAGEFTAIRVDLEYTFNGKVNCREQRWYAAGIGEVKSIVELGPGRSAETVLKAFKYGKD